MTDPASVTSRTGQGLGLRWQNSGMSYAQSGAPGSDWPGCGRRPRRPGAGQAVPEADPCRPRGSARAPRPRRGPGPAPAVVGGRSSAGCTLQPPSRASPAVPAAPAPPGRSRRHRDTRPRPRSSRPEPLPWRPDAAPGPPSAPRRDAGIGDHGAESLTAGRGTRSDLVGGARSAGDSVRPAGRRRPADRGRPPRVTWSWSSSRAWPLFRRGVRAQREHGLRRPRSSRPRRPGRQTRRSRRRSDRRVSGRARSLGAAPRSQPNPPPRRVGRTRPAAAGRGGSVRACGGGVVLMGTSQWEDGGC
ncbi:hypothetical protein SGRIM128S_00066 [Streptomyces griseomycini]